jgi:hypothetical protein
MITPFAVVLPMMTISDGAGPLVPLHCMDSPETMTALCPMSQNSTDIGRNHKNFLFGAIVKRAENAKL